MTNSNYIIQMGTFDSIGGISTGNGKKLGISGGQVAQGLFVGNGYKAKVGFQYIYSTIPFTFSISTVAIDFGNLISGEPITRTNQLTISNGSAGGYAVTGYENHPLRNNPTGSDIPDTTCDAGTCTQTTSAAWTNPLTYGFGYRCDNISGTDCASGFTTSTFYKQFANLEGSESPVTVMSSSTVGASRITQITYKVNVSASQVAGAYNNQIVYIATPTY